MIATKSKPKEPKKRKPAKAETAAAYEKRLQWQTEANRAAAASARDFGKFPPVKNRSRKAKARRSFRFFCETYLSETFNLAWSPDHLDVIQMIERAVLKGGLFALAMPRGSGKTSLTEAAALWAALFGFRKYIFLIGATERHATDLLESIRIELESNGLLLEDFPAICLPIRKLEGNVTRKLRTNGKRVRIKITAGSVHLPWVIDGRNGPGAGAIIETRGITGAIRGAKAKLYDGSVVRPDFVIPDDPQTDESAGAPGQVEKREATISGAVLGLAGPGEKISGVMPCTVIADNDLAHRFLNRDLHPQWNGVLIPFVKSFPTAVELWEAYRVIWGDSLREHGDIRDATAFYRKNRKAMDAGAGVSWESRFEPDELSAIQHAMNKKFADEPAFWSEYQNNPREGTQTETRLATSGEIAARTNGLERLAVMAGATYLTGFVDVQQRVVYYALAAWRDDFTGSIIDYGTFPDQGRRYFSLNDISRTLSKKFPKMGIEGAIVAGLDETMAHLFGREYVREDDGATMLPNLVLIDANWKTATVRDFVRKYRSPAVVPAHGRFVGASSRPLAEYKKGRGERSGLHWKSSVIDRVTHVLFDSNFWKSFVHERLGIAFGDSGNLTLFGKDATAHRMIGEHLTAEYRVRVKNETSGRVVDEWKEGASRPDNHLLDCVVGAAVAGAVMGASLPELAGSKVKTKVKRRRRRFGYLD